MRRQARRPSAPQAGCLCYGPSFRSRISPASCGFALPFESFITWPLRKFSEAALPGSEIGGRLRIRRDHLIAHRLDRAGVAQLLDPFFLDDRARRDFPLANISAKTSLPLLAADLSALDQVHQLIERFRRNRAVGDRALPRWQARSADRSGPSLPRSSASARRVAAASK